MQIKAAKQGLRYAEVAVAALQARGQVEGLRHCSRRRSARRGRSWDFSSATISSRDDGGTGPACMIPGWTAPRPSSTRSCHAPGFIRHDRAGLALLSIPPGRTGSRSTSAAPGWPSDSRAAPRPRRWRGATPPRSARRWKKRAATSRVRFPGPRGGILRARHDRPRPQKPAAPGWPSPSASRRSGSTSTTGATSRARTASSIQARMESAASTRPSGSPSSPEARALGRGASS